MNKDAILVLGDDKLHLPLFFKRIGEVSESIFFELIQKRLYRVESNVRRETLELFINYWQTGKLPEINPTNYWEFYLLSQEFGLMNDHLSQPKYEQIHKISLLKSFHQNGQNQITNDKSAIERSISENLDFYIENFSDELFQIPIKSLYNIFNSDSRNLTNNDRAYELIINKSSENKNLLILLQSLKAENLNKETVIDSAIKIKEHNGFSPQTTSNFIQSIEKFKEDTIIENNSLKKALINMKKTHENEIKKLIEMKQNQIQKIQSNYNDELQRLNKMHEGLMIELKNKMEEDKKNYINEIQQLKNQMEEDKKNYINEIQQLKNQMEEDKKKYDDEANELKKVIESKIVKNKRKIKISEVNNNKQKSIAKVGDANLFKSQKGSFQKDENESIKKFSQSMKPSVINKKNPIDFLFIIDWTKLNSTEFNSLIEIIDNMLFTFFLENRGEYVNFGCICHHDPMKEMTSSLTENYTKHDDLINFLDEIKNEYDSKTFDYAEKLKLADGFHWRRGKKAIICVSASSNDKDSLNINKVIISLAIKKVCFLCLYYNNEAYESFCYMKRIYDECNGPAFIIKKIDEDIDLKELFLLETKNISDYNIYE